eukprot:629810-Alexandrium_andersonii.AAC.1
MAANVAYAQCSKLLKDIPSHFPRQAKAWYVQHQKACRVHPRPSHRGDLRWPRLRIAIAGSTCVAWTR